VADKEIKSGVLLKLKDEFSKGMGKAAGTAGDFAEKTVGALGKVNSALSGTAAKLGALGLTLSIGAATKTIIELDHRMARLGLTANASAKQIASVKQAIYAAAQSPDIKVDPSNILSALEVVMTKTGKLKYAEENIRNIGIAIQASGESGEAIGDVFSEFQKLGFSAGEISKLMDDMVSQSDQGEFTFAEFARNAKGVISVYRNSIGGSTEDIKRANAAMQILTASTKSSEVATTVLNSAINELKDPAKRREIEKLGISVRSASDPTRLRDFNEIMLDLAAVMGDLQKADKVNSIFGSESIKAIDAYRSAGRAGVDALLDLGDTTGALERKSAVMAGTLKSNLQGLQTAFVRFADSNLTEPLAKLTDLLNKLAEDPKRIEAVFNTITRGLIVIGGIKMGAGVVSFLSALKNFKGGSAEITEQLSLAGGAGTAMPVYVTNWGGGGSSGGSPLLGLPGGAPPGASGLVDQYGNPIKTETPKTPPATPAQTPKTIPANVKKNKWNLNKPNWKAAGIAAGGAAAITAALTVPGMVAGLTEISKNGDMTKAEKTIAKGGAIGEAAGAISGAAAGALAGAAIGSVVPVFGTALGALVGGLVGQFGGPVGRVIGEKVGEAVGKEKTEEEKKRIWRASWRGNWRNETPAKAEIPATDAPEAARMAALRAEAARQAEADRIAAAARRDAMLRQGGRGKIKIPASTTDAPELARMAALQAAEARRAEAAKRARQGANWRVGKLPPELTRTLTSLAPQKVELEGQADLRIHVDVSGEKPSAAVSVDNRIRQIRVDTGHAPSARRTAF
jgi:hypothetical protein